MAGGDDRKQGVSPPSAMACNDPAHAGLVMPGKIISPSSNPSESSSASTQFGSDGQAPRGYFDDESSTRCGSGDTSSSSMSGAPDPFSTCSASSSEHLKPLPECSTPEILQLASSIGQIKIHDASVVSPSEDTTIEITTYAAATNAATIIPEIASTVLSRALPFSITLPSRSYVAKLAYSPPKTPIHTYEQPNWAVAPEETLPLSTDALDRDSASDVASESEVFPPSPPNWALAPDAPQGDYGRKGMRAWPGRNTTRDSRSASRSHECRRSVSLKPSSSPALADATAGMLGRAVRSAYEHLAPVADSWTLPKSSAADWGLAGSPEPVESNICDLRADERGPSPNPEVHWDIYVQKPDRAGPPDPRKVPPSEIQPNQRSSHISYQPNQWLHDWDAHQSTPPDIVHRASSRSSQAAQRHPPHAQPSSGSQPGQTFNAHSPSDNSQPGVVPLIQQPEWNIPKEEFNYGPAKVYKNKKSRAVPQHPEDVEVFYSSDHYASELASRPALRSHEATGSISRNDWDDIPKNGWIVPQVHPPNGQSSREAKFGTSSRAEAPSPLARLSTPHVLTSRSMSPDQTSQNTTEDSSNATLASSRECANSCVGSASAFNPVSSDVGSHECHNKRATRAPVADSRGLSAHPSDLGVSPRKRQRSSSQNPTEPLHDRRVSLASINLTPATVPEEPSLSTPSAEFIQQADVFQETAIPDGRKRAKRLDELTWRAGKAVPHWRAGLRDQSQGAKYIPPAARSMAMGTTKITRQFEEGRGYTFRLDPLPTTEEVDAGNVESDSETAVQSDNVKDVRLASGFRSGERSATIQKSQAHRAGMSPSIPPPSPSRTASPFGDIRHRTDNAENASPILPHAVVSSPKVSFMSPNLHHLHRLENSPAQSQFSGVVEQGKENSPRLPDVSVFSPRTHHSPLMSRGGDTTEVAHNGKSSGLTWSPSREFVPRQTKHSPVFESPNNFLDGKTDSFAREFEARLQAHNIRAKPPIQPSFGQVSRGDIIDITPWTAAATPRYRKPNDEVIQLPDPSYPPVFDFGPTTRTFSGSSGAPSRGNSQFDDETHGHLPSGVSGRHGQGTTPLVDDRAPPANDMEFWIPVKADASTTAPRYALYRNGQVYYN